MNRLKLKIPPVVVFLFAIILIWLIHEFLPSLPSVNMPSGIAYAVALIGFIFGFDGIIEFHKCSTTVNPHRPDKTSELVCNGVYRLSRNPMYLALLLALIAAGIRWSEPFSLAIIVGFIFYMNHFQIRPEEKVMEKKFGSDYVSYKKKVRRWI